MTYDIAVIGGGPAGLSAALNGCARGKRTTIFANGRQHNPLYRSERVDNYLGMPGLSGAQMLDAMTQQACDYGAKLIEKRVVGIVDVGGSFLLNTGNDVYEARAIVLAIGVVSKAAFPGEKEFVGAGVSYCATCDGMFYRNRPIVVVGRAADAPEEANFLASIGCQVTYTGLSSKRPEALDPSIVYVPAKKLEITGNPVVQSLLADGQKIPCDGVFILREALAPASLLPDLEQEEGFIKVDRLMHTSIPGVFAAGDCTGRPLQVAKAVGEGLIAAQEAAKYLDQQQKPAG